ncbi:MAG: hypothetical protein JWM09_82 [Francisellaceae bacterium]|nr:hypothetical protein [Francisellaceae bacterium]
MLLFNKFELDIEDAQDLAFLQKHGTVLEKDDNQQIRLEEINFSEEELQTYLSQKLEVQAQKETAEKNAKEEAERTRVREEVARIEAQRVKEEAERQSAEQAQLAQHQAAAVAQAQAEEAARRQQEAILAELRQKAHREYIRRRQMLNKAQMGGRRWY